MVTSSFGPTPTTVDQLASAAAHDAVTLTLAERDKEHAIGTLDCVYEAFRTKPLVVKAFSLDNPNCDYHSSTKNNIKTIHVVRHGQGFHNLLADKAAAAGIVWEQFVHAPENPYVSPEIVDAPLTEKGRQQALLLRHKTVPCLPQPPQLIVLSPNCRALQTGLIAFADSIGLVPFIAHEMVREETGVHCCDQRRSRDMQAMEFPHVDFSLLTSNHDDIFQIHHRETKMEVASRIYEFLEWLAEREEEHIVVASHSSWLLTMFNGVAEIHPDDEHLKEWFQTGEMRSCKMVFEMNDSGR
jgi:broad specificity phosphatase PhoE